MYILSVGLVIWFTFSIPRPLFPADYSTVVFDKNGEFLGGRTAHDEQWRFPPSGEIPEMYAKAVLLYEDEWFYYHPGFNPVSMFKAAWANFKQKKIVRGGSTLSMQVVRLSRNNPKRSIWEKATEVLRAVRLEIGYSKKSILSFYAANAPFGGNVVGLEAASWRYFGRSSNYLSAGEYATLAVLPNAPGLIRPGKNALELQRKRDALLLKMRDKGIIDEMTYDLAKAEPVPTAPLTLPQHSYHFVEHVKQSHPGEAQYTSIDMHLHLATNRILEQFAQRWKANHIYNAAVLIVDVHSGNILSYNANLPLNANTRSPYVDMIQAQRSSASTLKPLLYAAALQEGQIAPHQLLPDVPTYLGGFRPQNYSKLYDGAVPASEALSRSLNIPMVHLLKNYKPEVFLKTCRELGLKSLNKPAEHYGLSLILGGGEVRLLELVNAYTSLARRAMEYDEPLVEVHWREPKTSANMRIDRAAAWQTIDALQHAVRPEEEAGWENFALPDIAWKTGTSFGFRDAWSIGISGRYVVGVWVGNASGEGRPGLIGGQIAAPVMFQVFRNLTGNHSITNSYSQTDKVEVCNKSGYLAGQYCDRKEVQYWPLHANREPCPYHQPVLLNAEATHRVDPVCYQGQSLSKNYFVLPPSWARFYQQRNANYETLPPWHPGCEREERGLSIIYPEHHSKIVLPRDRDGRIRELVLQAASSQSGSQVFWDINGLHIGNTRIEHNLGVVLKPGKHLLTITDEAGNMQKVEFFTD